MIYPPAKETLSIGRKHYTPHPKSETSPSLEKMSHGSLFRLVTNLEFFFFFIDMLNYKVS